MLRDPIHRPVGPWAPPQRLGTGRAWGLLAAGVSYALRVSLLQNLHDSLDLETFGDITQDGTQEPFVAMSSIPRKR